MASLKMRIGWRWRVAEHTGGMEGGAKMPQNGALVQAELERQLAADDAYDSQATPFKIDGPCLISLDLR